MPDIRLASDRRRLLTRNSGGGVGVHDVVTGANLGTPGINCTRGVAWIGDHTRYACMNDGWVRVFDATSSTGTHTMVQSIGGPGQYTAFDIDALPDGSAYYFVGRSNFDPIIQCFDEGGNAVNTAGSGLYRLATDGSITKELNSGCDALNSIDISPDGTRIAVLANQQRSTSEERRYSVRVAPVATLAFETVALGFHGTGYGVQRPEQLTNVRWASDAKSLAVTITPRVSGETVRVDTIDLASGHRAALLAPVGATWFTNSDSGPMGADTLGMGPAVQSPTDAGSGKIWLTSDGTAVFVGVNTPDGARARRKTIATNSFVDVGMRDIPAQPVSSVLEDSDRGMSPDGRFVLFRSGFSGLDSTGPTAVSYSSHLRDVLGGDTITIPYPAMSSNAVSSDGNRVLFWSGTPNLTTNPPGTQPFSGGYISVYIWDRAQSTLSEVPNSVGYTTRGASADFSRVVVGNFSNSMITRVVEPSTGRFARIPGEAEEVAMSRNGRWIVVYSRDNRIPQDRSTTPDQYRFDVDDLLAGGDGDPVLVSLGDYEVYGDSAGNCIAPGAQLYVCHSSYGRADISDDGRFVLFNSTAPLNPGDTISPLSNDVYLRDIQNGRTYLVSQDLTLGLRNDNSMSLIGLAGDGSVVAMRDSSNRIWTRTILVDSSAPVVSGVVSPQANGAGWHSGSVTVTWSTDDPTASTPAPTVVSTEGAGQVVVSSPSCDPAGNCASGSVVVSVDVTSPSVVGSVSPALNGAGWASGPVTVSASCADGLSGVAACSGPQLVSGEGAGQVVSVSATDVAGNTVSESVLVSVDVTAPVVELVGPADGSVVQAVDYVAPSCVAGDGLSGLAGPCSVVVSAPSPVTGGYMLTATASAADLAGNSASVSSTFTVIVDVDAPVVSYSNSPSANSAGWWNTAVTTTFSCSDPSGVALCPAPVVTDTEGANQSFFRSASDAVGNTASVTVSGLNIDLTAPTVTVGADPAANAAGWNNTAVTVTAACGDSLSGVDSCSSAVVHTSEGVHPAGMFTGVDVAGNSTTVTGPVVKVDLTAPIVSLNAPVNGSSVPAAVYNPPTCTASDGLSGLDGVCTVELSDPVGFPGGYTVTATATATDRAGNSVSESSTFHVVTDVDAPQVTFGFTPDANVNGWWNGPVTVGFTCTDNTAIASCPSPVTVAGQGANQSITRTATDVVGNSTEVTVSGINIDLTNPTVTVTAPVTVSPVDTVTVTCAAADALSGIDIASCADSAFPATALVEGANVFTFSATDRAGNTTTVSRTVTLVLTPSNIGALITSYVGNQPGAGGLTTSLVAKLNAGDLAGFINEVNARCCLPANGKRFTRAQADTLIALATQYLT